LKFEIPREIPTSSKIEIPDSENQNSQFLKFKIPKTGNIFEIQNSKISKNQINFPPPLSSLPVFG
jgi:hypothetical protein